MDLGLISVRYARALLKASDGEKLSQEVYSDMKTLAAQYVEVPELGAAIANPMLSPEQKKEILLAATGNSACSLTQRFISLVLSEGREDIMRFIAGSYITLYRKQNNLVRAKLSTAARLSSDTEVKLRNLIESQTKGTVEFHSTVDPELIGGFVLEYDTYRLDASVKSRLGAIRSGLK